MKMKNLPKGWEIKKLGEVAKIIMGQSPSSDTYTEDINCIPFFQGKAEFTELYPVVKKYCTRPTKIAEPFDVLLSVRAPVGTTNIANQKCCIGRGLSAIRFENYKYGFYFLRSIQQELDNKGTGTTFRAISGEIIRETLLPYPPLETQQRIVTKIEELFSELDKGVEELKKTQEQLKTYRQSVLKWAFEGRFTNQNVKDGELPDGWEWKKICEISKVVRGGSPRPAGDPKFYDGNIPFLKVADLTRDNGIYLTTYNYTIKEAGLHKTRQISPNTLLLTNSGATLGVPKICMIHATMNDGVAAFLDLDERSNHYMYYFWLSKTLELRGINMGAGQPNLNTDLIKEYKVPYCTFEEQHQIVQEIESRLSVADKLEEQIKTSLQQAEALRQSILKKAFEGELVR